MSTKLNKKPLEKDWRVLEFFVPIKETTHVGNDFLIKGMAINETTTRNGIKYVAKELESAAPSFRNKPILLDHKNEVGSIVGRTTENVLFSKEKKGIEFEAKIMDESIQKMINDGRITDVSIGAKVTDLIENKDEEVMTAVGLEGLEISLVAVPGDPGANIASAMEDGFLIKEAMMNGKDIEFELNDDKEVKKMAEEEQKPEEEEKTEAVEPEKEEPAAEPEKAPEEAPEAEEILKLKKEVLELKFEKKVQEEVAKRVKEQEVTTSPAEEEKPAEKEKPASEESEDETKGEVGTPAEDEEETTEGLVIEKAEIGKGFQIYRDYSKDVSGKFKRLAR